MANPTKKHPVNGMEYLKGREKVIFENGIVCTLPEFEQTLSMSVEELDARMASWEKDVQKYMFDFRYAVSTGIMRRKAKFVPQVKEVAASPVSVEVNEPSGDEYEAFKEPEEELEEESDEASSLHLGSWTVEKSPATRISPDAIILYVMIVVGLLSAVMSAYHTATCMQSFGRPLAVGIVTGIVMVLFSATAFTAGRWFLSEKGAVKGFSAMFLTLGTVIVMYSMLSTLTVNYGAWKGVSEAEEQVELEGNAELEAYDKKLEVLSGRIESQRKEVERLEGEADYWKAKSWAKYDTISSQIKSEKQKKAELEDEYTSLLSDRPSVIKKAQDRHEDVFTFLASFVNGNPRTLRLFMQAVPAMFFDVIAPFALSCAVYLAEKRRKRFEREEVESSELD